MAKIETWFTCDLHGAVQVHTLENDLFNQDSLGNLIGVRVYSHGEPVTLSGSVNGYIVRSDGVTVPVAGTRSGNQAYITMPSSAYAVVGTVQIVIKLTEGSSITTLAACVGYMHESRTGSQVDPGSTVTDWTNQIAAELQAVEDAKNNMAELIAVPYENITFPVVVGTWTTNAGKLHKCKTQIDTSEAFTASHWTQTKVSDEFGDLKSALDVSNVEVFGGVGEGFPLEFENGTYEFTASGKQLIKYYGGGYNLTRKVVKSTTFTPPCRVNIKAKTGYSFTVFLSASGVISSDTGLITEYIMLPGQQYGMTLRTTGGSDNISAVPVSSIIEIEYESEIDKCKDYIEYVMKKEEVDLSKNVYSAYISPSTMKWSTASGYNCSIVPVPEGFKKVKVVSNDNYNGIIALLKSSAHTANTTPDYATGETGLHYTPTGESAEYGIPSDCKYIYVYRYGDSTKDRRPQSVEIMYFVKSVIVDDTLTKSGEAADSKVTGDKFAEVENLQDAEIGYSIFGTSGYGINKKTGKRYPTSSSFCTTGNVDVSKYEKLTYKRVVIQYATAPIHGMAFYDANGVYISGLGSDYGSEKTAGYEDYTIAVPIDAKYARFTIWAEDAYGGFGITGESILKSNIEKLMAQNTTNDTSSYKWLVGLVGMPQKTNGKFNVAARMRMLCDTEWIPIAPVPRERYVSGNIVYDSFPQGEKQTGIPYGAQLTYEQWIGKNISFETFLSALANPNSVMYDFSRVGTAYRAASWYSVNCSKAVAWALNLPNVYGSGQFANDPHINIVANAGEYTAQDIHIGDIIESIGVHTAFITDLVYNSFGDLSQIEVSEAVTPTCRRKRWNVYGSFENFFDVFSGYRLERYDYVDDVPPINMEAMFPYISPSLGLNYGNKSNYLTTDTIEITLLKKVSNTLIVKKDGEQIGTVDVTSVDESSIVEYTQSTPGWYEIGFSGDASKNYVAFCVNDNAATFDASTSKLTFASTESSLFMVSYSTATSRSHLKDVFPTAEDLVNGYMILNVPNYADYIHVTFANDYGKTIIEIALS